MDQQKSRKRAGIAQQVVYVIALRAEAMENKCDGSQAAAVVAKGRDFLSGQGISISHSVVGDISDLSDKMAGMGDQSEGNRKATE